MLMTIFSSIALIFAIFSWVTQLRAKEQALGVSKKYCDQHNWQLLDDTVALKKIRIMKEGGKWHIVRHYQFDYCQTGDCRESARLVLIGQRILGVSSLSQKTPINQEIVCLTEYRKKINYKVKP